MMEGKPLGPVNASLAGASEAKEPLQIRIPRAVKRRFKAHAAMRGMEPNELFVEVWGLYETTRAADASGRGEQDGTNRPE
jgi:hypothetical protein